MAKESDGMKWLRKQIDIINYINELGLNNDEKYISASKKEKKKMLDDAFVKLFLEWYPDTDSANMLRRKYNIPPTSLPEIKIELEGYTVYLWEGYKKALENFLKDNGKVNLGTLESGTCFCKQRGENPGKEDYLPALYAWINHEDKTAIIAGTLVTISEFKQLLNGRLPTKIEIERMTLNFKPWIESCWEKDVREMAKEYFPGQEEELASIYRKHYKGYFQELKDKEDFANHKATYNPSGRRVKVRDMKPGYLYTFADMSLECYIKYVEGQNDVDHTPRFGAISTITNAGLMTGPFYTKPETGEVRVRLKWVEKRPETVDAPSKSGRGIGTRFTGKTIWRSINALRDADVERFMAPDDLVVEAYPFPVGIYREDHYMEWIPDPDKWERIPADTPYNWKIDHVDVWDSSDINILIIVGIISFICACGGSEGFFMGIAVWVMTGFFMRIKHNKVRREVIEERERRGVRGPGLDDHFRYK